MGTLPAASLRTASSLLLLLAALGLIGSANSSGSEWGYEGEHGPSEWPGSCQTGEHQSPIDFGSTGLRISEFEKLFPVNYELSYAAGVENNGHSVQLGVKGSHNMLLVGGGLNRVFVFEQLHFHWGSEHTIEGVRSPLEAHFVHFDKARQTFGHARKRDGGLAVLGVLFEEDSEDNPDLEFLRTIDGLEYGGVKDLTFTPKALLPANLTSFYRYYGSLTTPGCDEIVLWTVLHDRVPISKKQLQYFAGIQDGEKRVLQSNYRPVQSVNDRIVYFQKYPTRDVPYSDSPRLSPTSSVILASLVSFSLLARKST